MATNGRLNDPHFAHYVWVFEDDREFESFVDAKTVNWT
jgi:hypothetical protein